MPANAERLVARLAQLAQEGRQLVEDATYDQFGEPTVEPRPRAQWYVSARAALVAAFGESAHYVALFDEESVAGRSIYSGGLDACVGILNGAQDDIEHGALDDMRMLVAADLLDDYLEQARHLLDQGYKDAAAMLAGATLEALLRRLCERHSVDCAPDAPIKTMNDSLGKRCVYTKLRLKQVDVWADTRNNAAHARFDAYKEGDVREMLEVISGFAADYCR